jgi:hypothetical protein
MNGRPWTPDEEARLAALAALGVEHIAAALGRGRTAINSRASKLGISLGRLHASRRLTDTDQFRKRVEFDTNGGCWLWRHHLSRNGYGQTVVQGSTSLAHRVSWEVHRGPIPDGAHVCHRCDVRACVNPDHLFLGTHADNMADMARKGRRISLPGERAPNAKLTDAQAAEVIRLLDSGMRPAAVAREMGLPFRAVIRIRQGAAWGHLGIQPKPVRKLQSRGFERRWTP